MVTGWCARGRERWVLASLVFWATATLALPSYALEPSIWYRTGEGCPDGATFLERLESRGVRGHLAAVGDHVDFVVTLGVNGAQSSGRLERQTDGGTIAIREVEDARCDAVAEALALTLALTLDPALQDPSPPAAPKPETPPPSHATPPPASAATVATVTSQAATVSPPVARAAPPEPTGERSDQAAVRQEAFRLGAVSSAWDLFEGPWLFSVGAFGEVEAPATFAMPGATLRLALQGGPRSDADASAQIWLGALRIEACPWALGQRSVRLRPCAAFDAGAIGASAEGGSDTAFWSAAAAHARLSLELGNVMLEAQAGGIIPITHYEVTSPSAPDPLEETSAVGFAAGVGVCVGLE